MKYVLLTVEHDQGVMFPVEAIEAESLSQAITIAEAKQWLPPPHDYVLIPLVENELPYRFTQS